ncbi:MAG: efflux RND transporter permease subunit [Candidatus Nitrospinota bacterium M3_3B_026]
MNLPELSIRRHALAFMLSAVLVLFGIISYQRMGVDRFPQIDFPIISVTTILPGANPEIVDSSITNIIETSVNSVPGIEHIRSTSSPGVSVVNITFDLNKDIDVAFNEVQTKVNQSLRQLPDDTDPPIVGKVETGAQAVLWMALQGDRTLQQLNQYARNVIKKRLETINGVGEVLIGGERERVIRVEANLKKLAAFHITTQDIIRAFQTEHIQLPGGFLVSDWTENLIKLDLEFHQVDELGEMILAHREGAPIKLKDVARIVDGLEDYRQLARFNSEPAVGIGIVKIANANTIAVIESVKQRLREEIRPNLPPGMKITIASDHSVFIQEMIDALNEHIVLGTLLAAIVVWLFLKSFRSTVIIALAIPVSLLGAVAVMYMAEFTFNTMTLLALLLLIGIVVDDAIVVLENIFRHRENIDPNPMSAAINGSNQVVFAVMASTFTLVSIFAPVIFMGGIIGQFFKSFAIVVTFGVLVSLFVSLTLTPMLCSRFLQVKKRHVKIYYLLESVFQLMESVYRKTLGWALAWRWTVVVLTIVAVSSSFFSLARIGKGFVPEEDEGRFMVILKTPLGSNIDYTKNKLKEIEKILFRHEEIEKFFSAIGLGREGQVNQGIAFVHLAPREERTLSQGEIVDQVKKELFGVPGVRAFATKVPIVGGVRGEPLQFAVQGPNLDEVAMYCEEIRKRLSEIPDMGRLDLDLQLDLPQYKLRVDRTRAAGLGLSSSDVAMAINALAGGMDIARYNDEPGDGERYDIRMKATEGQLKTKTDLQRIYLRSNKNELVRLDTIADFVHELGPAVVSRYDLQYAGFFFGSPSMPLGEAVTTVEKVASQVLPLGYKVTMMGQAEEFGKTAQYMMFTFVLATILVYMVLASQFNSFIQPLIVMIAQPLAMIGGIGGLWLTGHTLNIYSMIGVVLLIGLVAKNSILLIDLANQLRAENRGIEEALKEACPIRLRPVLMTSLTVILALLPAALGLGAGSDTNGPLSVAVIGGMITSTLLTLVVVPAVYSLVENGIARLRARFEREAA